MARVIVKIEGLKELDKALGELPKATAKATLRRVLVEGGELIASAARRGAPVDEHYLYESIDVSTKLNRRQRSLHKDESGKMFQEMFVGTNNPAGVQQEFGNEHNAAQPFMRPAWDAKKQDALERITVLLWGEIEKSAQRLARKAAKGK
jgi:HK97 gp10 family phage protein